MNRMNRLPQGGEANWGAKLNEFLLVGHHENGELRNQFDVVNVRDYGATGADSQSPEETANAIQAAITAGKHLYFPAGIYKFTTWTFDQDYQRLTFAPNAVLKPATETSALVFSGDFQAVEYLRIYVEQDVSPTAASSPKWTDGLIQFSGTGTTIRNLAIEAQARVARLVKVSQVFDCRFENIQILAPYTTEGVYVENLTKCTFAGGAIKGNNSNVRTPDSVGLVIGADEAGLSAYEIRAFGLTVHHWETGVRFAGISHQDPTFFGCNFENNVLYGISFVPPSDAEYGGVIYNLGLFGCHFEGTYQSIYVAVNGNIQGAIVSGCLFSLAVSQADEDALPMEKRLPQRIINAQGHLRGMVMSGCFNNGKSNKPEAYIWEVNGSAYNCADLFNYWVDMPNGNFSIGAVSDRVIQMTTASGDGRSLDLNGWFTHHGDGLGFYGVTPVARPSGYTSIVPQSGTVADLAVVLNKLTDDLASLGLIAKSTT